jgi:NADPH:quinone reductase-like Zn-dependent oxidoreductase
MRAIVHDRYGPPDVLRLEDVPRPEPAEGEILIKVHATTVNRTDCHIRAADPFLWRFMMGLRRPKNRILGNEVAGEVAEVGAGVTEFAVGDEVFGSSGPKFGAHAEFLCRKAEGGIVHKPPELSFEEAAAATNGALSALTCLRKAGVREGHKIVVYGASGAIGTAGVQLAKYFGADVTAVCNTKNVELVRTLGADRVIDYTQEDFTKNGETYEVIFDAVGKHSFRRCKDSLKPGGVYIPTDGFVNFALWGWTSLIGNKKVKFGLARGTKQDVLLLKELLEAGEYRPVIDRTYPLEDVVEASRYVETEQKTGNVVLTVS